MKAGTEKRGPIEVAHFHFGGSYYGGTGDGYSPAIKTYLKNWLQEKKAMQNGQEKLKRQNPSLHSTPT